VGERTPHKGRKRGGAASILPVINGSEVMLDVYFRFEPTFVEVVCRLVGGVIVIVLVALSHRGSGDGKGSSSQ
jgi:hypothetical protein